MDLLQLNSSIDSIISWLLFMFQLLLFFLLRSWRFPLEGDTDEKNMYGTALMRSVPWWRTAGLRGIRENYTHSISE